MAAAFTRKPASLVCLAALGLALSACASFDSIFTEKAAGDAAMPADAAEAAPSKPVSSPVLAFVTEAAPFESAQLKDPLFGGLVSVTLEAEYHSASDKECRRFEVRSLSTVDGSRLHHACVTDSQWILVELGKHTP